MCLQSVAHCSLGVIVWFIRGGWGCSQAGKSQARRQEIYDMKNIGQMLCICSFFGLATHVSKASEPQNLECMLGLQATQSDCRIEKYQKNSGHRALLWIRG